MQARAGEVIHAYCNFASENKFFICISSSAPFFLLINSEPRVKTPDAQIKITPKDFPFLDHDSYIDASQICTIFPEELKKAVSKGPVPLRVNREILKVTENLRNLSQNQKDLIKNNLSPPKP